MIKEIRLRALWHKVSDKSTLTASTALTALTNITLAVLGMVSGILAARLLGPHGRGELAAIQTWPSFIATLAMLGMPEAVVYYSALDQPAAGSYLGSAVAVALVSSVPFMTLAFWLMPLLLHAETAAIVRAGRWYLLLVPLFALVGMLMHPLRGRSDFVPWNLMRLMPNTLWIFVLILAWACSHAVPTFVAASNLVALASLVFPFAALVVLRVPGPFKPDRQKLSSMLEYGLPCMLTGMPQILNLRLDQMLMAAFLSPRDLGLYVVAVAWSAAPAPLLSAVGVVMTPAVASASDAAHGARRLAAGVRITAALAAILCLIFAAVTPIAVIVLFGVRFRASIPAALVLMPAGGILSLNLVLQEGLRGLGRPYPVLRAELAGLVVTGVVLISTLRSMGMMGAAIASLLGYSTVTVFLLRNVRHYTDTSLSALLVPSRAELRVRIGSIATLLRQLTVT